jgi:hypothetical protein
MPDNTWLQQLDIKQVGKTREIQLSGETTSSSKLIEPLEQSRVLQNAATRGTETRGSQPNTVRFMIAAEPRPRTLPEATPVTEISAPVAVPPQAGVAPPAGATPQPRPRRPRPATVTPVPPPQAQPGGILDTRPPIARPPPPKLAPCPSST